MTTTAAAADSTDRDLAVLGTPYYRLPAAIIVSLGVVYALTTVLPAEGRPAFLDTWFYSGVLVATSLLALARPLLVRRQRAAWLCVGLAVTSWSAGDIYWSATFSELDAADIPVPSPADVLYVGMYPLAYAGLIMLARGGAKRLPASVWLDGLVTSLAAGAVFSAVALDDVLSAAGGDDFAATVTNLSYPIGDLVLMVVAVAALAMVRWKRDAAWWLLGLGAAAFAVADTAYLFQLANETYVDGTWVDGMWMLGLTLMALAGAAAGRESAEDIRGFTALLVPILFSLSALGVLVVGTFIELHPVAIVMASGCLVAAGIRTAVTFEQSRELARTRAVAETDELSGLGNRRMLDSRLPAALQAIPQGSDVVLTIVSVDHLPEINRILGYPAGDAILQVVGTRLREYLPPDTVAVRLGGAEVAIMRTLHGSDVDGFLSETRALLSALSGPVLVGQVPVHIELSAGVAAAPSHAERADELIRCAADALRSSKTNRSNLEIYEPSLQNDFGSRLFPDLLRGINEDEFVAYYQPKFDLAAGRPTAIEAVLRWHHPSRGVIDAEAVHPLAAQVGLTRQLTLALLQNALQQCAAWRRQGVDLGVAADVTVADILDSRLPYDIAKMINKMGIPPSTVTLEIAEDVLLIDPRRTAVALGQFRHFGIRLSLDHYGRSAPSLTRLRSLRIDELKLDATFVRPILESAQDAAIVRSTIDLARSLRIVTVVDGVDSRELLDAVMACGCELVQGAALGEPMSPDGLRSWLAGAVPAQTPRRPAAPPPGQPSSSYTRVGARPGPGAQPQSQPQPAADRTFPQR